MSFMMRAARLLVIAFGGLIGLTILVGMFLTP
jgi:hypothetical protein